MMKIRLRADSAMGENFSFGLYTKENRAFLEACGDGAVLDNVQDGGINYYKLHNGFLVHKYYAYEVS